MDPVAQGYPPCLRAIMAPAGLVTATEKIVVGSPLTIFVHHTVEAVLNSHHTQYFFVSRLISYEILLFTAPHITLLHCNNLNPASLLPSVSDEVPHDCLMLLYHLLTPDDLQEILLGNIDFSCFTDVSYLKGNNVVFWVCYCNSF